VGLSLQHYGFSRELDASGLSAKKSETHPLLQSVSNLENSAPKSQRSLIAEGDIHQDKLEDLTAKIKSYDVLMGSKPSAKSAAVLRLNRGRVEYRLARFYKIVKKNSVVLPI
jgi:hypothetical protein